MKKILKILLFFFGILQATAQDKPLHFTNYTVKNGLPTTFVSDICQDKTGFIWIGTNNGLSRFDGSTFLNFSYDPSNENSLSGNRIYKVMEDKNGIIWICSNHGLDKFLKGTQTFHRYNYNSKDSHSIPKGEVYDLFEDSKGRMWVCVSEGFCQYIPEKDNFNRYSIVDNNGSDELLNCISSVQEDKQGNIWLTPQTEGIYRFIPETGTFVHQTFEGSNFKRSINPNSKQIYISDDNTFWLATRGNGFFKYVPATGEKKWYYSTSEEKGLNNNIIFDFMDMPNDELWIGTDGGGVNILNKKTGTFRYLKANKSVSNGLQSNATEVFFKDKQNNIWIGTVTGGVYIYNEFLNVFEQYRWTPNSSFKLTSNIVLDVLEDKSGLLWIGTDGGGLNSYNLKTNEFKTYFHKDSDPYSISGNVICSMLEDDSAHLWTGNFATGLNYFNKNTGKSICYMPKENDPHSLTNENVWHLLKDKKGNLWIATLGGGMSLFNPVSHQFENFSHKKNDPNSIVSNLVNCITDDRFGNIWIATDEGLSIYNPSLNNFHTLPLIKPGTKTNYNELHCIFTDKDGMIWVGASWGGLFKIDPATLGLTYYDFSNGQLINSVMSIIEDNINQLWIGTSNGLGCLNKSTGNIIFYDERDGLPSSMLSQTSCTKLRSGNLVFGCNEGFFIFDPQKIKSYPYPPILVISDFKIDNKSILAGDTINGRVILQKAIYETDHIALTYKEREWTLGFSVLQFVNQRKTKVMYRLEGYSNDWREADNNTRSITYTYLPSGTYRFNLKAENGYGVWCKPIVLVVTIEPPFWKTIWFIFTVIILFVGLMVLIVYLRLSHLNKRKKILENIVKQRTRELADVNTLLEERTEDVTHQNDELFTLNLTLEEQKEAIQKQNIELVHHRQKLESTVEERTKELQDALKKALESERLKSAFLANMSHEIRTPMNAILGFSGLLSEKRNSPEKVKNYIEIIQSSGKTLLVLIDDIIDFSKIEAGILEFFSAEFDFEELLCEVQLYFTMENINPNIKITVENNCRKAGSVFSDKVRTHQIITNLMVNALKFTKQGSITLGCTCNDNEDIVAFVRDTGIGIPPDKFEYIFQPFNKIEDNMHQLYRGAGLGLTISNHLATQMGYTLWVESEQGIGSTFYLKIPKEKRI